MPSGCGSTCQATPQNGTVTVNGASVGISVGFSEGFTETITETGLPTATVWWFNVTTRVAVSGTTSASVKTISDVLPNGTWNYHVGGVPGYVITTGSSTGTVNVAGATPAGIAVTFTPILKDSLTPGSSLTQVGGSVMLSIGVSGGAAPYSWTLVQVSPSVGLVDSGSAASGSYAVVPPTPGLYVFDLNATDSSGQTAKTTATVTVNAALVATLTPSLTTTQAGTPSILAIALTNGVAPYSWTLVQVVNGEGGPIDSGTAAYANYSFEGPISGTYTFYLNATDSVGSISDATATVVQNAALTASLTASLTTTQLGTPSNLSISLANGVAPYSWTLVENYGATWELVDSGTAATAAYSSSPAISGTFTFYLNATDSVGSVASSTVTVIVNTALTATLTATPNPTQVGTSSTLSINLAYGVAPYAWTLTETYESSDATLVDSGTAATATYVLSPSQEGNYQFYLNATDSVGSTSNVEVTVLVNAPASAGISPPTSTLQVGASENLAFDIGNGVAPYTWTLQENNSRGMNLESGVNDNGGNYEITPLHAGTYTIYLNGTDSVGSVFNATATVTVEPALVAHISPATATIHLDGAVTYTLSHTGGVAPVTYTLQASGPGLSGDTFTPTAVGTYTVYYNTTDKVGSVSDVTATVTVHSKAMYPVTFTETGLPAKGKAWSVMFNGTVEKTTVTAHTATNTTIEFDALNGSYVYEIIGPSGYQVSSPSPAGGTLTVAGAALPVAVTMVKGPTPTLSVHETGIGAGVQWCAIVLPSTTSSGTPSLTVGYELCSTTATIAFKNMTPGTYAIDGVQNDAETDLVKVGSSWVVESQVYVTYSKATTVQFRYAFLVTFTETGLTSGTSWSVTSQGQTLTSTTTTALLYLTNGTRGYTVHAVSGYKQTSMPPGHVVVAGGPASVSVTFTPKTGHAPAAGTPTVGTSLSAVVRAIEVVLRL